MRSFYFAVELRRARFDIAMPNALVFDMPVEQSLHFITPIRSDLLDTKGKLVDNVIDEINGIFWVWRVSTFNALTRVAPSMAVY